MQKVWEQRESKPVRPVNMQLRNILSSQARKQRQLKDLWSWNFKQQSLNTAVYHLKTETIRRNDSSMDPKPLSQQHKYLEEKNVFSMLKSLRSKQRQRKEGCVSSKESPRTTWQAPHFSSEICLCGWGFNDELPAWHRQVAVGIWLFRCEPREWPTLWTTRQVASKEKTTM